MGVELPPFSRFGLRRGSGNSCAATVIGVAVMIGAMRNLALGCCLELILSGTLSDTCYVHVVYAFVLTVVSLLSAHNKLT